MKAGSTISFLVLLLLGLAIPSLSQFVYTYDRDQGPPPQSTLFDPSQYQFRPPSAVRSPTVPPAEDDEEDYEEESEVQTPAPRVRTPPPAVRTANRQSPSRNHYVPPPRPTFSTPVEQPREQPVIYSQPVEQQVRYRPIQEVTHIPPVQYRPIEEVTPSPPVHRPIVYRQPLAPPTTEEPQVSYRPPPQRITYIPAVQDPITYRPPLQQVPVTYRPPVVERPATYSPPLQEVRYRPPVTYTPPVPNRPPVQIVTYRPPVQTVTHRPPVRAVTHRPRVPQPTSTSRPHSVSTIPHQPNTPVQTATPTRSDEVQIIQITADQLKNIETIDGKQFIVLPDGQRFQLLSKPEPQPQYQYLNQYENGANGYSYQTQGSSPTARPELVQTEKPSTAVSVFTQPTTSRPIIYRPPVPYQPPVPTQIIAPAPAPTPAPIEYQPPRGPAPPPALEEYQPPPRRPPQTPPQEEYQPPPRRRKPSRTRKRTTTPTPERVFIPPPTQAPERIYIPPQTSAPIRRAPPPVESITEPSIPRPSSTHRPSNIGVAALPPDSDGDGIPGEGGVDYPTLYLIPQTSFSCARQPIGGYYADLETACQLVHFCQAGGVGHSFLCPNGTIFNQEKFSCQWWYKVNCATASQYYALNDNLYKVPSSTPAPREQSRQRDRKQRQQRRQNRK